MTGWMIGMIERHVGVRLEYLRHIAATSPRLFYRFLKIFSFANCRRAASAEVVHTAALAATIADDCGECVQIGINMARRDNVPKETIQAVLDGRRDALPENLRIVYDFATASLAGSGPSESLREEIRKRHGEPALVELAMTLAAARVFPQVKRALGYAVSCSTRRPSVG